jgi:hypothetical protein
VLAHRRGFLFVLFIIPQNLTFDLKKADFSLWKVCLFLFLRRYHMPDKWGLPDHIDPSKLIPDPRRSGFWIAKGTKVRADADGVAHHDEGGDEVFHLDPNFDPERPDAEPFAPSGPALITTAAPDTRGANKALNEAQQAAAKITNDAKAESENLSANAKAEIAAMIANAQKSLAPTETAKP